MRTEYIFVDAENVGTTVVKHIAAFSPQRMFVFSKLPKVYDLSQALGFHCINDYPKGNNQADFAIIGLLGQKIAAHHCCVSHQAKPAAKFILYTHDKNLIKAFKNQCMLNAVACQIISPNPNLLAGRHLGAKERILRALKTPQKLNNDLWGKLQLSQAEFTRTIGELIRSGKITRSHHCRKYWVLR